MKYLLDTNILSDPIAPKPNAKVAARLEAARGNYATAAIVFHELLHGCLRRPQSKARHLLEDYIADLEATIPILPYDTTAARWHAQERARLYQQTPPYSDGQIAAVAAVNDLIVVTRNVAHFKPFSIAIENWFE